MYYLFIKPVRVLLLLSVALCRYQSTSAQDNENKPGNTPGYYQKQMVQLQQSIQRHFYDSASGFYRESIYPGENKNPASYLWPLCALLQANNEVAKVLPSYRGLMDSTFSIIRQYYDTSAPAPGYASYIPALGGGDRFYDDNQWIGIALMDAYNRTGKSAYIKDSEEIYRFMMSAYDTAAGGGLYWQEGKLNSKNTCSNGPGIILALQLYKATGNAKYQDTALMLYNWVNRHLQAPSGLYYDNIATTGRIDETMYSYNTGTMMQSGLYLYELTNDPRYLKAVIAVGDSAMHYFLGSGQFRDSYWFNAVLFRAYQHLLLHVKDLKYIRAFKKCTDYALRQRKNSQGLMENKKVVNLVGQAGMLEILARLALLEKEYSL